MESSTATLVTMTPMRELSIVIEYSLLATAENWLRSNNISVGSSDYAERVTIILCSEPDAVDGILEGLNELTSARFEHALGEALLVPITSR